MKRGVMGAVLRVEWLRVRDRSGSWQERYDLDGRLVAIVGPIDRGKTSMVDCLDYLFGRQVTFKTAVFNHVSEVQAQTRIGDDTFRLSRKILRSQAEKHASVCVTDTQGNPVRTLPIAVQGTEGQTLSDWLLERLGLADMFDSVRLSGDTRLNFAADLLPYLRIRQEDIDRFVIRENTGVSKVARVVVLRLLLFMTTEHVERLRSERNAQQSKVDSESEKLSSIRKFVRDGDIEGDQAALDVQEKRLRDEEARACARLEGLRTRASSAANVAAEARRSVSETRERIQVTEREHEKRRGEQHEITERCDEVRAALTAAERAADRHSLGLPFAVPNHCPTCQASLRDRDVTPGHCRLCTEPLRDEALAGEQKRLASELKALENRAAQKEKEARAAADALTQLERELAQREEEVDSRTAEQVTPYVDGIAAAVARLGDVRGRLAVLERERELGREWENRETALKELKAKSKKLDSELKEEKKKLVDPTALLDQLNALFLELVKRFELPWATGRARLDEETLLPLVDEQSFQQRGGGSRAAVSVAYSLTLLKHALEDPARMALPTLLILDSPQRNFGSNDLDAGLAKRMYTQLADYLASRSETPLVTDRYDTVQLIVLDNSLPEDSAHRFDRIVRFDETTGFVRDLVNPHRAPSKTK